MTISEAISILQKLVDHGTNPNSVLKAWNPEAGEPTPVTGFLFDNVETEICTDEP